jgi:ATP-dependent exoDNAse (exonuclease V) alpha subunit
MILSSTNKIKDEYTDLFKDKFDMKKIYITSNNRHYSNGEILITNEEIKGVSSQERYCYTTHSIQGETAYDKLFIDINQIFDVRMFYTALSRAMYLDQIYLISN